MLGADGEHPLEAELRELRRIRAVFRVIDFVNDENDRLARAPQETREFLIHGHEALLPVHEEKQHVARGDGDLRLSADLIRERGVHIRADAARVEDGKRRAPKLASRGDAVARDARLVVDDRDFSPGQTIEERGLPDIRTAYDGDGA